MKIDIRFIEVIVLVLLALISDIKTFKIKNIIVLPFILIGLITNTVMDGIAGLVFSLQGIFVPILLLGLFFILRMLGAGDIKLFSAIGAVIGMKPVVETIVYSFLAGGVIALAIMIINKNGRKRFAYLLDYFKSCILTLSILPYTDFQDKSDGAKFRFTYAIACGVILQLFTFTIVCHAQDITISLSAGESYELTNNSRIESTIQTSNPYLSNSVYDYAIYNQDGCVHETGMLKNQLGIYKVPAGGRMVITVVSSSKPMEFRGSDQSFTGKPAAGPALNRIALKPGENYEFWNNGTAENSLEVIGDDTNISYDYAVYNKDGTVCRSSISVSYNTSIKVPAGGRAVITAASTSKPVGFGGAGQFFSGSFSANPALHRVTVKAGEQCHKATLT